MRVIPCTVSALMAFALLLPQGAGAALPTIPTRADKKTASPNASKAPSGHGASGCTVTGGPGDDVLRGTPGSDVLCGRGGRDILLGSGGKDRLLGGTGADRLVGGNGPDVLIAGAGDDEVVGGEGSDALAGNAGNDIMIGGTGGDRINGGTGVDRLNGNNGNDVLVGGANADELAGGAGSDRLLGGDGPDFLSGGDQGDVLLGGRGPDRLLGGRSNDRLNGGTGRDACNGGPGRDHLRNCEGQRRRLDISDTDGDGIPDDIEQLIGTNPRKADTDADGLTDGFEIEVGGDQHLPFKHDTDGDGKGDSREDVDSDGLDALAEQRQGTDPTKTDTDGDGLGDAEETPRYHTDPELFDTDSDGISDGDEVRAGDDPRTAEVRTRTATDPSGVTVTLTGRGDLVGGLNVEDVSDEPFYSDAPDQVSKPFDLSLDAEVHSGFQSAELSLPYDPSAVTGSENDLRIFIFDERERVWLPVTGAQTVDTTTHQVRATVSHFSVYAIFHITNWIARLTAIGGTCRPKGSGQDVNVDVPLVLDSSGSMTSNDPNNLRLEGAKRFVQALRLQDRAAIVDFDDDAVVLSPLTTDKAALEQAINQIDASGGTNIGAGVRAGLDTFTADRTRAKILILLTDGEGSYDDRLTDEAAANFVTIYTIGLGSSVNQALLQDIARRTGGEYFPVTTADQLPDVFRNIEQDTGDDGTDTDSDRLTDCQETNGVADGRGNLYTSDPRLADTDGDGLTDKAEIGAAVAISTLALVLGQADINVYEVFSDPRKADTDSDDLNDGEELRRHTHPRDPDTDNDGTSDGAEVQRGTDPTVAPPAAPPANTSWVQGDCRFTCTIRIDRAQTRNARDASWIIGAAAGACAIVSAGTLALVCGASVAPAAVVLAVAAGRFYENGNCLGIRFLPTPPVSPAWPVEVRKGTYNCR